MGRWVVPLALVSGCQIQAAHESERQIEIEHEIDTTVQRVEQQQEAILQLLHERCR